jgi:hypothetical protein
MPYKSDKQRRFFHSAGAKKAGISKSTVDEWDRASKGKKLPRRLPSTGKKLSMRKMIALSKKK